MITSQQPVSPDLPTAFLWRLTGGPGPLLYHALPFGEAVRAAVMRASNRIGLIELPDSFHGGSGHRPHSHAYWISEDRDGDGLIDHVLVYAGAGIPAAVIAALAIVKPVWLPRSVTTWSLSPVWMGRPSASGLFGPARRWEAVTAYVTSRWQTDRHGRVRPGLDPETQLCREITLRGLPRPMQVLWKDTIGAIGHAFVPADFLSDTRNRRAPRDAWKGAPMVVFAEPVDGPLAFGFGSHFGLGLMRRAE